ncbi:alpha/beta hydrolase [Pseudomonas nicosulfuronedens]
MTAPVTPPLPFSVSTAPRPSGPGMPVTWRLPEPDADARAFLRMLNLAERVKPVEDYSLSAIRELWRLTSLALGTRPAVAAVEDIEIEGPAGPLQLRLFRPRASETALPVFLWFFGGGFMVGDLDTCESICRNIALSANCVTVAVRYRLAPEHDLNASREDCLAALEWLVRNGAELAIDTQRIAIGGDSAGGNLCAAIAQKARQRKLKLALQVLVYPATELLDAFPSLAENADGFMVSQHMLQHIQRTVAGALDQLDPTSPWLSPRRQTNLKGVAPAVVVSAGFDPIRDDGLDYASRLRGAGVAVQLLHYPGQFHGFLNFDAINGAARDALMRISDALIQAFDRQYLDTTVEIADAPAGIGVAGETSTTALSIWNAVDGWRDALLLQLSPQLARTARWLLRPYLVSTRPLRRCLNGTQKPRTAEQTYPAIP